MFKCVLVRLNWILMVDSDGAQEAQKNPTLRSLMKGNILILTVSRVIWSISGAVVRPYMSLYILALGGSKPVIGFSKDVHSITEFAEKVFREQVEAAGFEVGRDLDLPQVSLTVIGNADPDQPDALSLYVAISVYQPVYVDRLQRKLVVPTATILKPELTTQGRLLDTLREQVAFTVSMMRNFVKTADEYVAATEPPDHGH